MCTDRTFSIDFVRRGLLVNVVPFFFFFFTGTTPAL